MSTEDLRELLSTTDAKLIDVERGVKMPLGTLSKALNGTRALPSKWDRKLKMWVKKNVIPKPTEVIVDEWMATTEIKEAIGQDIKEVTKEVVLFPYWFNEVEEFCNKNNCTYRDLMDYYATGSREAKKPDSSMVAMLPKVETFFEKRQREALK